MGFQEMIAELHYMGVTDVLLPFILVFTIVFATLQKTKIVGEGKRQFNVIIALVMALSVVIPHVVGVPYPFTFDPVDVLNQVLPQVSTVVVAILMLLIMVGVFGANIDIAGTSLGGLVVLVSIIGVIAMFGGALGWFEFPYWLNFLYDSKMQATIVSIVVFGGIMWFIAKDDTKTKKPEDKTLLEKLGQTVKNVNTGNK